MVAKKKSALGRGLGALIDNSDYENRREINESKSDLFEELPVEFIEANPFQPRTEFDKEALNELADSIKQLGIIQPITVRRIGEDKFQLISGERRFRAAQLAGLERIPSYIRIVQDNEMLELALVENIQRQDLNAIEVALSYQRLIDECNLTQASLSERVGKKRATITNYLRLLKLPAEIQIGIRDGIIAMGHARALINIEDPAKQTAAYFRIVNEELSVRAAEEMVRNLDKPDEEEQEEEEKQSEPEKQKSETQLPEQYVHFQDNLHKKFESKVELKRTAKGNGKIIIPFVSDQDLERIMELLQK